MSDERPEKVSMGDRYRPRGVRVSDEHLYAVMGLPKLRGQWVSVAQAHGGAVLSMPESIFRAKFYKVIEESEES